MDLREKIEKLKHERNAVILAHNYQIGEVQDIADYCGDSLGLSIEAAKTKADIIVFCGVYFMAETAKILSPKKTVLIPDRHATCPMAKMITVEKLKMLKKEHPKAKVICYVNSTAAVKAESDICCTSANAVQIVDKFFAKDDEVIFVPDKHLADYTAQKTNRKFITWNGFCPTHIRILKEDIIKQKESYPDAKVIVHPECAREVRALADEVLSTGGMCKFAKNTDAKKIIVSTENGLIHRLKKENPDKNFYPATELAVCPNMKLTNLEKVFWSLQNMQFKVELEPEIMIRAKNSIERMIELST